MLKSSVLCLQIFILVAMYFLRCLIFYCVIRERTRGQYLFYTLDTSGEDEFYSL
jgi:hypothetical protein